jgi:hypothetical protein
MNKKYTVKKVEEIMVDNKIDDLAVKYGLSPSRVRVIYSHAQTIKQLHAALLRAKNRGK